MNTQFINATDINPVWFHFFNIYTGERKTSHLDDFAHLQYKLYELHQSRATFVRATDRSIDMLTKALNALRKNKTHITDDHIERVIDDLVAARKSIK